VKRITFLLLILNLIYTLIALPGDVIKSASAVSVSRSDSGLSDGDAENSNKNSSKISNIIFKGNSITLDGNGAIVDGSKATIISAGTYNMSGTLDNGQIIVNTKDKKKVKLVLNGVDITCSKGAPLYVINAKKTVITLADGTENFITEDDSYIFEDATKNDPNAAIFSKDELTINGNGSLTVNAKHKNGIQTRDKLKITGGKIIVNSLKDGIKGRDYIAVKDGNIVINSGGDGMQSNNNKDPEKGYVSIEGGEINITSEGVGIRAKTNLMISGGNITISSGDQGSDRHVSKPYASIKGINAGVDITISGGTINIASSDDSIYSDKSLKINGGEITLASGNDGIGSSSTIEINGGDINITKSHEGIESQVITINDGNIHLTSYNDGINAVGYRGSNSLNINGGYIVVDAYGDGFDINGSINMTGGVVIINGPTQSMNGPLEYHRFNITGGFIVAVGSSRMAMAAGGSISSTQYSVMVWFTTGQEAGTLFNISAEDGKEIMTFSPKKAYSTVTLCSPELKKGSNYIVYSGGTSTGKAIDGLYSGGTYTPGDQVSSFAISSSVTYAKAVASGSSRQGRW
jgi:hypothetical protein